MKNITIGLLCFFMGVAQAEPLIWPKKLDAIAKHYGCVQPNNFYRETIAEHPPYAFLNADNVAFWCQDNATGKYNLIYHAFDEKKRVFAGCPAKLKEQEKEPGGLEFKENWGRAGLYFPEEKDDRKIVHVFTIESEIKKGMIRADATEAWGETDVMHCVGQTWRTHKSAGY